MALIVFIDESGKPTPKEKDPYVVAALLVDEAAYHELQEAVEHMLHNVLIRYSRGTNLPLNPRLWEIHAKDIVQSKGDYKRLSIDARVAIIEGVIEILKDFAQDSLVEAIVTVVLKDRITYSKFKHKKIQKDIVARAYGLLMERLVWALESDPIGRQHDIAILVVDESELNENVRDVVIDEVTRGIYTSRLGSSTRVLPDPIFAASKRYRGLQLADVIAYIARRIIAGRKEPGRFNLRKCWDDIAQYVLRRCPDGRVEGCGIKIWRM